MSQERTGWSRPLVVGASGQVGVALCRALEMGGAGEVLRSGREGRDGALRLDLAALSPQGASDLLVQAAPDLILCAGAMTFVDGCEDRPKEAFLANAYGPSVLAMEAHRRGIPFVYFSSDYVFDGTPEDPGPYDETKETRPLNVYGRSKLEGERAVLRVHPEALVVRTSWVYGPDAAGKNFISALLRQLRAGQPVRVPADQVSTPTLNQDLARVTLALAEANASGVVHVTGPELMSRLQLAQAVARVFHLEERLIEGVTTASLGQRAARPLQSGLVSNRLRAFGTVPPLRSLQAGLQETAATLQSMAADEVARGPETPGGERA